MSFKNILPVLFCCAAVCACQKSYDYIFLSDDYLRTIEKKVRSNPDIPAFQSLIHIADSLLEVAPKSVMDKEPFPPSGDKHDYMSMGIYWWPNPDTPDGLPYVRRDGLTNPEIRKIKDAGNASRTFKAVENLALAYRYTGEEKYAAKASELLKVWFLNPDTRMNPNMKYAQGIPGVCEGRGTGIIDLSLRLPYMYDFVTMLRSSKSWTKEDDKAFKSWVKDFNGWLTTSEYGIFECNQKNNHGTNYDVLVIASYLFIGEKENAAEFAGKWSFDRFDQIAADGSQPRELERTSGWSYVMNNTRALLNLAAAAQKAGVDYWTYTNPDGANLQKAIDWIAPYMAEDKDWDYQDVKNVYCKRNVDDILCFSHGHLDLEKFRGVIDGTDQDSRIIFLYRELK